MDDLSRFCCQNPKCPQSGRRGAGNLTVCGHYGKCQRRLLYCNKCKARFSERKGTVLFGAQLPETKCVSVLEHLAEGCGVRKTARLVGVSRSTVERLGRIAGDHAKTLHDELAAFSPSQARDSVRRKVVVRGKKAGAMRQR
jgi:transposase-like protein